MVGRPGTFWVRELADPASPTVAPPTGTTFTCAGPEAADDIAAMTDDGQAEEVRQRLTNGRRCYFGRLDGEVVAYGWVSFDHEDIGEQGLRLSLPAGEAYVWNCVTAPAHRRRGLYAALLAHIAAALRAEGLRRAWIGADLRNMPSQMGMARAGYQPVLDLYSLHLWGHPFYWVRRRPGVPPALVADARHVLLGS